jgi:uncharacterized membrane protein
MNQKKRHGLVTTTSEGLHWRLRKNCSFTPRQLFLVYVFLAGASLLVACFFWVLGALLVLPFACVEVVALAVAFWVYARHAVDGEVISCNGKSLVIEAIHRGHQERHVFLTHNVRIHHEHAGALIEVTAQGKRVKVGRYVRADLRPVLASELRRALVVSLSCA